MPEIKDQNKCSCLSTSKRVARARVQVVLQASANMNHKDAVFEVLAQR